MKKWFVALCILLALSTAPARAEDDAYVDLSIANNLDEEIVDIRVIYVTEDGEPNLSSNRANLQPGSGDWRSIVRGAIIPQVIVFELATKAYVFENLAHLNAESVMFLEISYEDGCPVLRRTDGDGEVLGVERNYLTDANRPYAVDWDSLTDVTTEKELKEVILDAAAGSDVEVYELAVVVDEGWGEAAYFPVRWRDWTGAVRIQPVDADDEDAGIVFALRFRIPEDGPEEMVDVFLSDLRIDDFRPLGLDLYTSDGEDLDAVNMEFGDDERDAFDQSYVMLEPLMAAYEDGSLREASSEWVTSESFDALKAGEEPKAAQNVTLRFSKGTFELVFEPNGGEPEDSEESESGDSANVPEDNALNLTSRLDEEVVALRLQSSTPDGESKYDSERANIRPGAEWLLYVENGEKPEALYFDFATKTYAFEDLSGFKPTDGILLDVVCEDGIPLLRQTASGDVIAEIRGEEVKYLTDANRPNAVDADALLAAKTPEDVVKAVTETLLSAIVDSEGETAGLEETVFTAGDGWGDRLFVPVRWEDWTGVAKIWPAAANNEDAGFVMELSFDIPDGGFEEMLGSFLPDMFVDSLRPVRFSVSTYDAERDDRDSIDFSFDEDTEEEKESGVASDAYDDQMALRKTLSGVLADGTLNYAVGIWVTDEAFDRIRAGDMKDPGRGAQVLVTRRVFQATFAPDARLLAK